MGRLGVGVPEISSVTDRQKGAHNSDLARQWSRSGD